MRVINTNDLTDAALDWATARAENVWISGTRGGRCWMGVFRIEDLWSPTTIGSQAMPIIEREIDLLERDGPGKPWHAVKYDAAGNFDATANVGWHAFGPTATIAALRCRVAAKFGDTVKIPPELLDRPT